MQDKFYLYQFYQGSNVSLPVQISITTYATTVALFGRNSRVPVYIVMAAKSKLVLFNNQISFAQTEGVVEAESVDIG